MSPLSTQDVPALQQTFQSWVITELRTKTKSDYQKIALHDIVHTYSN